MKSCLQCSHVADVEEVDDEKTMFRCALPLPPWRTRHGDTLSTLAQAADGLPSETRLQRGDHMAEHCHFFDTPKEIERRAFAHELASLGDAS